MSGITLLILVPVCLLVGNGGPATLRDTLERGSVSLNEMFREVEELMEDTQHILEEAVDQITTESSKSSSLNLQPDNNEAKKTMTRGPEAVQIFDRTNKATYPGLGRGGSSLPPQPLSPAPLLGHLKAFLGQLGDTITGKEFDSLLATGTKFIEVNNKTGEVLLSRVHVEVAGQWNSMEHQCMVDEDCGDLKFCSYEIESSTCLPCIPTDLPCAKDEECCSDQMCVWGQCTANVTRGTEGTICQGQSDCRPDLCCAFQPELLFPVCNPKPGKGESCRNHPNLLMDMLAWDQEGPRDHCPCADDIPCQPHGRGFVCGGQP